MGGSLQLWHEYFGKGSRVCGIDIIDECSIYAEPTKSISVEIGSQDDPFFLQKVAQKHGPFDIVIDDGSHIDDHILKSFNELFPHVKQGGYYIVEDINDHVKSGNSFKSKNRFLYRVLEMAERMQKYSVMTHLQAQSGLLDYAPEKLTPLDVTIDGVHIYRDLVIVEKRYREKSIQMPMPPHYHY